MNGYGLLWMKSDECQYRCPELDACINASVWCDGVEDCPSGIDEALTHCSILLQLPPLYLFLGALGILTSSVATCAIAWKRCRRRPRSFLQTRLKSLSSDTAIIDEKEVICWHSDNSVRYVEVDRVTTVWRCSIFSYLKISNRIGTMDKILYYFNMKGPIYNCLLIVCHIFVIGIC